MSNHKQRLKNLENHYHKAVEEAEGVIFICDFDMAITGYSLCYQGAGGELVARIPGQPLSELQEKCRDLDRDHRFKNPLQSRAPSIAFAENDLTLGVEP